MTADSLLLDLLGGAALGVAGLLVLRPAARDRLPLWLAVLWGVAGTFAGEVVHRRAGGDTEPGLDPSQVLVALAVGAGVVALADVVAVLRSRGRGRASAARAARSSG